MKDPLARRWRKGGPGELRRPDDGADLSLLEDALQGLPRNEMSVIPALQRAQEVYGYLPESVLAQIADELRVPWARVYGVATFYAQFHLKPRGRHIVLVCRGTACHVGGASEILGALEERLGIREGETTPDLMFTLETVACLGACALAPVIVVGGRYYGHLDEAKTLAVIDMYTDGNAAPEVQP
ncbi:MAG: NADH-quinone oxidoreductase subunit NuoE [Armatimonadetes bacterium]|nr:NADH-quinone oxidoreductase subunit NuoE [Armatimonadota bacterium]